ncbi:RNA polymerase sigma factor [Saccharicrinis sp. FJH2]|uniref:RNA polymerase sigma factor n=1 Tax=Saccharicrinis sp. FJH65 TaxID=3344659 RepID=UPI0035F46264
MESVLQSNISDIDLLQRVKNGDQYAYTLIVERYRRQVAKTVFGMLGDTAEVDDVGQDVFIRFYHSIDGFRGESSLGTYLTRIAINLSLNELKKRKRKAFFFFQKSDGSHMEIDVEDETRMDEEHDNNELVEKALSELEPKFRSVVVLRLIQGYSTKETAEMLDLPQGTVLSRLARAQDKLKEVIKDLMIV